ncbi:MAG: lasso peptide biosynthesis B2 protein [Cyanophyceae cyanobacterium]
MKRYFRALLNFGRIPLKRKLLYLEALGHLVFAWFLVRRVPFRVWSRWLGTGSQGFVEFPGGDRSSAAVEVAGAIVRLNGVFRGAFTCLMVGTAGKFMLNRRQVDNTLVLGVNTERTGDSRMAMTAHAWLCEGSDIILGGEVHQDYTPITNYYSSCKARE